MKLWQRAKEFTLADNFFMGAFGGSISACLIFPYKSSLRNPSPMALC
jgi:hypothetical protein